MSNTIQKNKTVLFCKKYIIRAKMKCESPSFARSSHSLCVVYLPCHLQAPIMCSAHGRLHMAASLYFAQRPINQYFFSVIILLICGKFVKQKPV